MIMNTDPDDEEQTMPGTPVANRLSPHPSNTSPELVNWAAEAKQQLAGFEHDILTGAMTLEHALARAFLLGCQVEAKSHTHRSQHSSATRIG